MIRTRTIYVVDCEPYPYLRDIIDKFDLPHLYTYIKRRGWDGNEIEYKGIGITKYNLRTK